MLISLATLSLREASRRQREYFRPPGRLASASTAVVAAATASLHGGALWGNHVLGKKNEKRRSVVSHCDSPTSKLAKLSASPRVDEGSENQESGRSFARSLACSLIRLLACLLACSFVRSLHPGL